MASFETIGRASAPDGTELSLVRRGDEWVVRIAGQTLMSSRMHGSEDALANIALDKAKNNGRVLVGGLGLGFTLRAVLDRVPATSKVFVAELVPAVVEWNREHVGHLAGHPLDDARVAVKVADVSHMLTHAHGTLDLVLLDVDNGPSAVVHEKNASLYSERGARMCREALAPGGVLAVWSAGADERYVSRLTKAGFEVEVVRASARGTGSGGRHVVFVATKTKVPPREPEPTRAPRTRPDATVRSSGGNAAPRKRR